jgi:hypothetical protein
MEEYESGSNEDDRDDKDTIKVDASLADESLKVVNCNLSEVTVKVLAYFAIKPLGESTLMSDSFTNSLNAV